MPIEVVGYVGVKEGQPLFRKISDNSGDCRELSVFEDPTEACARYFNVRKVRIIVDPEVIAPPAEWGAIDG